MFGKDGSRTPARLRLAVLLLAGPLSVAATSVVVEAAPVQPAAVTQTSAAPADGSTFVVDRGRGRGDDRRGDRGGDRRGDRGGDRGGDRRGGGRDRDRCGLLAALLFGCG